MVAAGAQKEQLALDLVKAFHPCLMKYLDMIVRGHLPRYKGRVNADAEKLLVLLLPKGTPVNRQTLMSACRCLHLGFKGCEPSEIYDVLATCLLQSINSWDL